MTLAKQDSAKIVYWHRELPPFSADVLGEHVVEATSDRVSGTLAHGDEVWDCCYEQLMERTRFRLEQEVARLCGDYAHVRSETIEPHHDEATGEAWLHGRFVYVLSRRH